QSLAECTAINDRAAELQTGLGTPIEGSLPFALAPAIESIGMLKPEERFRLAVSGLLLQVGARRLAAMVPDERARCEGDPHSRLLQPPADIHIIARFAVLRVEAVDSLQGLTAKGHIAPRNMLGHLIIKEDMGGLSRRGGDTGRKPAILRRQVGP